MRGLAFRRPNKEHLIAHSNSTSHFDLRIDAKLQTRELRNVLEHTWLMREACLCERHHSAAFCLSRDAQTHLFTDSELSTDPFLLNATNAWPLNNNVWAKTASVDIRDGKCGPQPL